jgi:hypothetical protein
LSQQKDYGLYLLLKWNHNLQRKCNQNKRIIKCPKKKKFSKKEGRKRRKARINMIGHSPRKSRSLLVQIVRNKSIVHSMRF